VTLVKAEGTASSVHPRSQVSFCRMEAIEVVN
jgi:hypothetical protein